MVGDARATASRPAGPPRRAISTATGSGALRGRRGARLAALTSGGAIPETADYRVVAEPDDTIVGTVNEDFAIESMAGDVFLLGSTSWRIRRVEAGVVASSTRRARRRRFRSGSARRPARTAELSAAVGELREALDDAAGAEADRAAAAPGSRADAGVEAPRRHRRRALLWRRAGRSARFRASAR